VAFAANGEYDAVRELAWVLVIPGRAAQFGVSQLSPSDSRLFHGRSGGERPVARRGYYPDL